MDGNSKTTDREHTEILIANNTSQVTQPEDFQKSHPPNIDLEMIETISLLHAPEDWPSKSRFNIYDPGVSESKTAKSCPISMMLASHGVSVSSSSRDCRLRVGTENNSLCSSPSVASEGQEAAQAKNSHGTRDTETIHGRRIGVKSIRTSRCRRNCRP